MLWMKENEIMLNYLNILNKILCEIKKINVKLEDKHKFLLI